MSEGDNRRKSAKALSKELARHCQSESLSKDGLREIIERYGHQTCHNEKVNDEIIRYLLRYFPAALVKATLAEKCASSSTVPIFQKIHQAIIASSDGSEEMIKATILSGGVTNYSYKIYVTNHPNLCLFAKLCFEYMSWNPDRSAIFDLQHSTNEYNMKKIVSKIKPDCVVAPLALWDIEHDGQRMKLLVTEWAASTDEQIANQ
jgi:hypothetical protein